VDHGLRRREADGATWIAYGGDFGEVDHDGNFVCDGLVSADRDPHPLLDELAALTQPVAVESVGHGRLRVHNRRWFSDLADLEATWELTTDGRRITSGRLDVPVVEPRSSVVVDVPAAVSSRMSDGGSGRSTLVVRFAPRGRGRPPWAAGDWTASSSSIELTSTGAATERTRRPARARRGPAGLTTGEGGISAGDVVVGWPQLSLWRAPTDNDDPPGEWRATTPAARWRADGLDRLTVVDADTRRRGRAVTRVVRWATGAGGAIEHRQRVDAVNASQLRISEQISIDRSLSDLPRVGIAFELPVEFGRLTWLGLGPGDSYPDRRAAVRFGWWQANVDDLVVPFVRPQEYGLHLDTNWFELASSSLVLRVHGDRPLGFSALPHSVEELEAATHAHVLSPSVATHVHVDVAHRGLGTAACGPDTHPRHLVAGGTYRFTWTLSASSP
jgi:beta-galactosidase